jgi:cytochrome P450 family 110
MDSFFLSFSKLSEPLLEVMEGYTKKYPDCLSLSQRNSPPVVYFYHPEAIKQIFTAPPEWFSSSGRILIPVLGSNSLIVLSGDRHQSQRKLLMPPFHGARMQTYGELITQITQEVISQWQPNKPFNVRKAMQEISLRMIMGAVFGINSGERYQELQELLTSLLESIGSPIASTMLFFPFLQEDWGAWSPWGRFWRLKQRIISLLIAEIEQRRAEADRERNDILSLLLSATDSHGQSMTNEELTDELLTLLFAGHETTASAIAWALYWIERSPQVKVKLQQELSNVSIIENPLAVTKLDYLTAIVQETLRIYPIAMNTFPRVNLLPIKILDYWFEAGTTFFASIYLTHRRPDIYPEPNSFKPERFLSRQFSAYEYLPFGGGNRLCIGYAFAQFEMKLVLANIFSQFELTRVGSYPLKPTRRGVTVAPPRSLQMIAMKKL